MVRGFSSFLIPMLIGSRSARDDAPDGYDEGDIDADSINTELISSKDAVRNQVRDHSSVSAHLVVVIGGGGDRSSPRRYAYPPRPTPPSLPISPHR